MRCSKCGNVLDTNEVFCGHCGAPVTFSSRPGHSSPRQQPYHSRPPGVNVGSGYPQATQQGDLRDHGDLYNDATEYISRSGALPPPSSYPDHQHSYLNNYNTPKGQQNPINPILLTICLLLVIALVGVISIMAFTLSNNTAAQPTPTPSGNTSAAVSPTVEPTPTATPTPSPTIVPTPMPLAGFTWCTIECEAYGFIEQYPLSWQVSTLPDNAGIQIVNPAKADERALYKLLGTADTSADVLLATELQTNYASKPGYQAPQSTKAVTIGGATWTTADIIYQNETRQSMRVSVFTTVHQGQSFVIELQASEFEFTQAYSTYYSSMINQFQFV